MMQRPQRLAAAARAVAEQLAENPIVVGIPVDPDVAEYMGAFKEDALSLADLALDGLLTVNAQGEVVYDGE